MQLALYSAGKWAYFSVRVKASQRSARSKHFANSFYLFIHAPTHYQFAPHAANEQGEALTRVVLHVHCGFGGGFCTIDQSIAFLLENQFITRDEAIFHSRERKTFELSKEPKKPKSIWTS